MRSYSVQAGPYPYKDAVSYSNYIGTAENDANKAAYEASLNSEENERFETYHDPYAVMGPRENYYTVQKGSRRYDTVMTQAFAKKVAPVKHDKERMDPALGSEYVSFPQTNFRDNGDEQYWDYVPIDNKLFFPFEKKKNKPISGSQRTVKGHGNKDLKNFRAVPKNTNAMKSTPKFFTDRHLVEEEHAGASAVKTKPYKAEIMTAVAGNQAKIAEIARKRQSSGVYVHNRSPNPDGKLIKME